MSTAGLYDLAVVVLVIIFAIRGFQKGLIHQIGALISMIAGVVVSVQYMPVLAEYLPGSENVKSVSAFVILLLAATLVVWGIVNAISAVINNLKLNSWNNQMGAILGVVYGILWAIALTFILLVFAVPIPNEGSSAQSGEQSFIMQSKFGPYLTTAALGIIDHLPQGGEKYKFYDYLRQYLQRNANEIKEGNPNLSAAAASSASSDETVSEDEKPRLPQSAEPATGM